MGFLTDEEVATVRVTRMILHVVGRKDEVFAPAPETRVQEELFFRQRILEVAASGVHSFTNRSRVRPVLEAMSSRRTTFEEGGQQLASLFFDFHVGQATSGAFFVFELRGEDPEVILYALVKYDYRSAVELSQQANGQSLLREIVQAFIKDKRAIQKFCLTRVREGRAEDLVSASDRMKEAPDLTDYFERYLGVSRSRSTQELSRKLNEAMRQALRELRPFLPDGDDGEALKSAKAALRPRAIVGNDDVVDAILHAAGRPEDEDVRRRIDRVTRRKLKTGDLEDVAFQPDRRTLAQLPRRLVVTAEEVKLEYPEDQLNRSVTRRETDNGWEFTVVSRRPLVKDDTLSTRATVPAEEAVPEVLDGNEEQNLERQMLDVRT